MTRTDLFLKRSLLIGSALLVVVIVGLAFAGDTQKQPCEPVKIEQMSFFAKSQESVRFIRVFDPINIFAARGGKSDLSKITTETKAAQVVKPKAKKVVKKKVKRGPCGFQRQVWRTLKNGHKKYRCK